MVDWDVERIAALMDRRATRKRLLMEWAQMTRPRDTHVWTFAPDDNILNDTASGLETTRGE